MKLSRSRRQDASPFHGLFVSYLVLIVLILAILIPFLSNTLQEVNETTRGNLSNAVSRTVDSLDATLVNLESIVTYNNDTVSSLSRYSRVQAGQEYYAMRRITQLLAPIVQATPSLHEVFVAYGESGATLASFGAFDTVSSFTRFYETGLHGDLFRWEDTSSYFVPSRTMQDGSGNHLPTEVLGYCFALKGYGRVRVCLLLRTEDYLGEGFAELVREGGCAVLQDRGGTVLKTIGDLPAGFSDPDGLSRADDASRFVTVSCTSPDGLLTLSARIPRMMPTTALARTLPLLLASFGSAIGAGLLYSVLTARHHARSVQQLAGVVLDQRGRLQSDENRIRAMQESVERLQRENALFSDRVRNFRRARAEHALAQLFFTGDLAQEDLAALREERGPLPDPFRVAYGKLTSLPLGYEGFQDETGALLLEQLERSLPGGCLVYMVQFDSVAVLMPAAIREEDVSSLAPGGIQWTFSAVWSGWRSVCAALEEARLRRHRGDSGASFSVQSLQRLYQLALAGEAEQARGLIRAAFAGPLDDSRPCYEGLRCALRLAADEVSLPFGAPGWGHGLSDEELCLRLTAASDALCDAVNAQKKSRNEERKTSVLSFLQEHFDDPDLSPAAVAEHAGISEKYLYNFVREQTGMSVGSYLLDLRMREAARLLRSEGIPVKDVCRLVGFRSENSFYKAFKRAWGVTPSQYREMGGM